MPSGDVESAKEKPLRRRLANDRWPAGSLAVLTVALLVLAAAQFLFTRVALPRLLYEELAESLRNPYWLARQTLYDRWSSNVGWYGMLAAVYSTIGFHVDTAKWVRLALHIGSLFFLAGIFVRWQGVVRGMALLLVVGLSSTWLYCNTYQTSYGIDLQFVPVLLLIVLFARLDDERSAAGGFWFGFFLSIGALCYPTTLFYLPFGLLLIGYRLWRANRLFRPKVVGWLVGAFACGFYLPIGGALVYLKDPKLLLDGLFRGGGVGLKADPQVIGAGVEQVVSDFFIAPVSYCFDLPHVEFSSWLGFGLFFVTVAAAVVYLLLHAKKQSLADPYFVGLALSLLLILWFLVVPSLIPNKPGIRRSTGLLVGYYGAFACLMAVLWSRAYSPMATKVQPAVAWTLVVLQLLANGLTLGRNLAAYPEIAGRANESWIMARGSPPAAIEYWFEDAKAGHPIKRSQFGRKPRFALRFAAVRALQLWNGRAEFPVYGVDPVTGEVRTLSTSIWERWEWPH